MTYLFSKLTAEMQQVLNGIMATNASRSDEVSVGAAVAIAYSLDVPTVPLSDVDQHYRLTHAVQVFQTLGSLNEIVPMNVELIRGLVCGFFQYRYYAFQGNTCQLAFKKETAIEDFFNISKSIPTATLDVIRNSPNRVTEYTGFFKKLLTLIKD